MILGVKYQTIRMKGSRVAVIVSFDAGKRGGSSVRDLTTFEPVELLRGELNAWLGEGRP